MTQHWEWDKNHHHRSWCISEALQFICERITSFQIFRHQQAGGSSSDQAERDAPRHVLPSHRTLWRSTGAAGLLAWFINFSPSVRGISPRLWCLRIQSTTTTTSVTSEPQNRRAAPVSFECACVCVRVCICTAALMRSSMINTWKTNIPPTSSHEGFYSILEGYIDPPIFSRESVDLWGMLLICHIIKMMDIIMFIAALAFS